MQRAKKQIWRVASTVFDQEGLLDWLKKALTERALNAEMDHYLAGDGSAGNAPNGYGRKNLTTRMAGGRIRPIEKWSVLFFCLDGGVSQPRQLGGRAPSSPFLPIPKRSRIE